jgi:hypothetical protein
VLLKISSFQKFFFHSKSDCSHVDKSSETHCHPLLNRFRGCEASQIFYHKENWNEPKKIIIIIIFLISLHIIYTKDQQHTHKTPHREIKRESEEKQVLLSLITITIGCKIFQIYKSRNRRSEKTRREKKLFFTLNETIPWGTNNFRPTEHWRTRKNTK